MCPKLLEYKRLFPGSDHSIKRVGVYTISDVYSMQNPDGCQEKLPRLFVDARRKVIVLREENSRAACRLSGGFTFLFGVVAGHAEDLSGENLLWVFYLVAVGAIQ